MGRDDTFFFPLNYCNWNIIWHWKKISPFFMLLSQEAFRKEKEIAAQQATVGSTWCGIIGPHKRSTCSITSVLKIEFFFINIFWYIPGSYIHNIFLTVSHQQSTRGCRCLNEAKMELQVGRHLPVPGESSGWWCSRRAWGELGELDPTQILKGSG